MSYSSMSPIERFATYVVGKPLYPYQVEAANAILYSIEHGLGAIITVMMARQSGKNQLSAMLEAFLLFSRSSGTIVKAAPTFNPQITNSRRRLLSMLENSFCAKRIWTSYAQIGLAPAADTPLLRRHSGPSVMFFSADPESSVVGATADLLLEIDEAQDVQPEKFDKDFRPMCATTGSTTVMYGTAWSDETLLARQRLLNLERTVRTGERRHFEYDWHVTASYNPRYGSFVRDEIARLGEQHLAVQTQYYLRAISGTGFFFNELQRQLLSGTHPWECEPFTQADACYIAGLDIGGEERPDPKRPGHTNVKRDSTVLTIGRVSYNELLLPHLEIVHQVWWTGMSYPEQYAALLMLCELWDLRHLVIDNTGQGAGLTSLLLEKLGTERVEPFTFTRPGKSKLGYQLLALVNSGRLKLYARSEAPSEIYAELWTQLKRARYRLPAAEVIDFYVQQDEGHDDFLISLALTTQALQSIIQSPAAQIVRARREYLDEGRY